MIDVAIIASVFGYTLWAGGKIYKSIKKGKCSGCHKSKDKCSTYKDAFSVRARHFKKE